MPFLVLWKSDGRRRRRRRRQVLELRLIRDLKGGKGGGERRRGKKRSRERNSSVFNLWRLMFLHPWVVDWIIREVSFLLVLFPRRKEEQLAFSSLSRSVMWGTPGGQFRELKERERESLSALPFLPTISRISIGGKGGKSQTWRVGKNHSRSIPRSKT